MAVESAEVFWAVSLPRTRWPPSRAIVSRVSEPSSEAGGCAEPLALLGTSGSAQGRCRCVTAYHLPVSIGCAKEPLTDFLAEPLGPRRWRSHTSQVAPLENAAQYAVPVRGRGSSLCSARAEIFRDLASKKFIVQVHATIG